MFGLKYIITVHVSLSLYVQDWNYQKHCVCRKLNRPENALFSLKFSYIKPCLCIETTIQVQVKSAHSEKMGLSQTSSTMTNCVAVL